jgi:phospholipase/carboxylesterase
MITTAEEIAAANIVDNAISQSDNSDSSPSTADFSALMESRLQNAAALLTTVDRRRCRSIQAPLHYEAGYAYPLLIWLHGDGGDERQLQFVMKHISLRNYVSAAPRGTASAADDVFDDEEHGHGGYHWRQEDDHIFLAQERIWDCVVEARKQYNINPGRVFLAGYQSGGTMALRIALSDPSRFAGAISMCGPLPSGGSPLGRFIDARRVPVLIASGLSDPVYPQPRIADDLRLLHTAGFVTTLRLYPGADELTDIMLDDLNRWVMEQVCANSKATTGGRGDSATGLSGS